MSSMKSTKGQILQYIATKIKLGNTKESLIITWKEYKENQAEVLSKIIAFSCGTDLIVRSSSSKEDLTEYSNAGAFESVLNVKPQKNSINAAVETVFLSYGEVTDEEEVLIQPMLTDIVMSGVVFTADMDTLAPYYVINYHEGNDSAAVTGGNTGHLKTCIKYRHSEITLDDSRLERLIAVCQEVEKILESENLDIEFAITSDDEVYILQARPIAMGTKRYEKLNLDPELNRIYKKIVKLSTRHPFLLGETTCFGVMPDWNPAEILGIRPKRLAISLYKELITDQVWANQRADYGYRDLTQHPLMVSMCGIPYIDTRITFNSFIPAKLNDSIAEKLVNYYLDKLKHYPKYHDKVEFEIVFSCYYLGIREHLNELKQYGFSEMEITRIEYALLDLTNHIIDPKVGLYKKDFEKIKILEQKYAVIMDADISLVDKIYWLIEVCKMYGTLPFAGIARAAFIAVQILKSFVTQKIITQKEYDDFMRSLSTVNKQMNRNLYLYANGELSKEDFLKTYGHIRPGTYDIMSLRYDEAFDEYFSNQIDTVQTVADDTYTFSAEVMQRIQKELEQNGLLISAEELIEYIKETIEGRESSKFVFTKAVSRILQLIEQLGNRLDISKEEMAYLDIMQIKPLYTDLYVGNVKEVFEENIKRNKELYKYAVQIKLPSLIVRPEDVYVYSLLDEEPNYITQKEVTADIVRVDSVTEEDCCGKIIFIQAADPGYDFIFTKHIAGLVTQYGGVNSHMAIRCAELGIPAVIGVGEKNFSEWSQAKQMTIDCEKKQIIIVR